MSRDISKAKALLEAKGYKVVREADLRIPKDKMFDPDKVDLRAIGRKAMEDEAAEKKAQEDKIRKDELRARAADIISDMESSNDPLQVAFDALVPRSGKADTVAGEMVRATMKLLYRDFNDGDRFFSGYGIETCGPAVLYLMDMMPELADDFESIAHNELRDDAYTDALNEISKKVVREITEERIELLFEPNEVSYLDYNQDIPEDWIPRFEYEIDIPEDITSHIAAGNITRQEFQWELESWDYLRRADITVYEYAISIEGLDEDEYAEVDYGMYTWLEQYAEDLNEEYGDPNEEEYQEYEDEEDYEEEE